MDNKTLSKEWTKCDIIYYDSETIPLGKINHISAQIVRASDSDGNPIWYYYVTIMFGIGEDTLAINHDSSPLTFTSEGKAQENCDMFVDRLVEVLG